MENEAAQRPLGDEGQPLQNKVNQIVVSHMLAAGPDIQYGNHRTDIDALNR